MKKILSVTLCLFLLFSAAGCASGEQKPSAAQSASEDLSPQPSAANSGTEAPSLPSKSALPQESTEAAVVYFSGTGNTAAVAKTIADVLDAPIYTITPAQPYSTDDLNYNDDNCRANLEQNDDSARPEIAGDLSEAANFKTIYLGYPIWWGTNPRIIETFLDAYELSGAAIYTFCTSGSSGIETSISHLQAQYPKLNIVGGRRFNAGASENDIKNWLNE